MESDQKVEDIIKLIRMAHRMCFTESALSREVQLTTSHLFNGQPIDLT
jgi:hypothetical protein